MAYLALLPLLLACRPKEGGKGEESVELSGVERVVTIGDNAAANPSWSSSYTALLIENDDELFPFFAGKDLSALLPGAEAIRLERGGESFASLAAGSLCVCGECAEPCLDPEDTRPTLVVVQLGLNDLVALALTLIADPEMDADAALAALAADVDAVVGMTADEALFPSEPLVAVLNVYDPSDGAGDFAALITSFFPFEGAENVTPEQALAVIDGLNAAIADAAGARGAILVDAHAHFLGHGMHAEDEQSASYDADDPTSWLSSVVDPNLRGAHELRRLLWRDLTGEDIADIPEDLPLPSTAGLPEVPDEGWADAVAESGVTVELTDGEVTYPNLAANADLALGEPGGDISDLVAIGVSGAWLTLELAEPATDGEGEDLVVLEFGAASGGTPEPYRAEVAEDLAGPWVTLGDAYGERAFDLAGTGLAAARYVRLESLAEEVDVLGGQGSPYYPGPEIDAVGAVYPQP